MKTKILTIDGNSKGDINLPKSFSAEIREDIVAKVLHIKRITQPYGNSPNAGNRQSASGSLIHKRHVWKSQYGRGMSRVPRKTMSRRGSQFQWEGAASPNTRGGRRAHPPIPMSMINVKKANKKELKVAFESALSATANKKYIEGKYANIDKFDKNVPFVIESGLTKLKTKNLIASIKKILGEKIYEIISKKKSVRAGIGKMRGRRYKSNAGLLIVVGEKEELKTKLFEVVTAREVGVNELARGGLGRITVYTEAATNDLEKRK